MGLASSLTLREMCTKGSGKMESIMVKEPTSTKMEHFTLEISKMIMNMVKVLKSIKIEVSTMDNTKRVKSMVLEFCTMLRVAYTLGALTKISYMARAHTNGLMVKFIREIGVKIRCMDTE